MQINITLLYKRNVLLLGSVWFYLPLYTLDFQLQLSHPSAILIFLSSLTMHYFLAISLLLYSTNFQKTTAQSSTLFSSIPTQNVPFSKGSAKTSLLTSTTFGKEVCSLRSWVVCSMLLNLAYYEIYDFNYLI